jgi:hypothetical protein
MSDSESEHLHATVGGDADGAKQKKQDEINARSGSGGKSKNIHYRFKQGVPELAGCLFSFGNQGQQSNYIKTKKALGDYFGIVSDFGGKEIFKAIKERKEPEFQEPEEPP